jgi:hypothetical protein
MATHWLESFYYADVYPNHGIVWQIACIRKVRINKKHLEGSTNPKDVTCKRCLRYLNQEDETE